MDELLVSTFVDTVSFAFWQMLSGCVGGVFVIGALILLSMSMRGGVIAMGCLV